MTAIHPHLSEEERRRLLVEWNETGREYGQQECIQEMVERQAEARDGAAALVYEGREMTYGELNRAANRLGHRLRKLGVKADSRVAICADRGLALVVGLLDILKAGGGYVPLDPAYPAERLAYMLQDSAPEAVLVQGGGCELIKNITAGLSRKQGIPPLLDLPLLDLETDAEQWSQEPETNPQRASIGLEPHHLAYIIYTSGSSGLPKGVMVEHKNVTNLIHAHIHNCGLSERDTVLQFASIAFDASVEEIFPPLAAGARVVLRPSRIFAPDDEYQKLLRNEHITVAELPTAFWHQWVQQGISSELASVLRLVVVGGEKAESRDLDRWRSTMLGRSCAWLNTYGPTETTVYSASLLIDQDSKPEQGEIPIGRPISNTQIYILDAKRSPTQTGVFGELYIGSAGVARGYVNKPEMTAESFMENPFSPGQRIYKTGDLGRWRSDGQIEYAGRNDDQVKIRGFRIELGEIRTRLMACPGVREAVVVVREDLPRDKRLGAYFVSTHGKEISAAILRDSLAASLPPYMIPSAFVHLTLLPLTPNGKLDRKALHAPESQAYVSREYEPPVGEVESILANIWEDMLKLERVGRHDNFFELGGHSLLVVTLIERMRHENLYANVCSLFMTPTLAGLAESTEELGEVVL